MSLRPALRKATAGTLSFHVPEPGTIAAGPTVSVFNATGTPTEVDGATATITQSGDDATLSVVVPADSAVIAQNGTNLRARWTCTVGTSVRVYDQLFDVRSSVLHQPIQSAAQLAKYWPEVELRDFKGVARQNDLIARAWEDIFRMLETRGLDPHLIVDPQPLEAPLAALAASKIASNYQAGTAGTRDWQAWAADRRQEAMTLLEAALVNLAFYDVDGNLTPTAANQFQDRRRSGWIR